ncbi:hypothetical protein ACFQ69_15015 [Streptomyces sp. NPDC056470]|uniref:hypothetical protein n=1 Tax=Streptomyces sp. NPDC056470 TaxID=3345831 RepID=UPI00369F07C6
MASRRVVNEDTVLLPDWTALRYRCLPKDEPPDPWLTLEGPGLRRYHVVLDLRAGTLTRRMLPSQHLFLTEENAENLRLYDVRDPRNPERARRLPATNAGYYPVGHSKVANRPAGRHGVLHRRTRPRKPVRKRSLRFDGTVTDIELTRNGRRAVTRFAENPYGFSGDEVHRIWDVGPDGAWRTPSRMALHDVQKVKAFPDDRPNLVVVGGRRQPSRNFVLGLDTDRIYGALCQAYPLSIPEQQWRDLLPHLTWRPSCDP